MASLRKIIARHSLILGGARSGKSVYGEKLAGAMNGGLVYIATAEPLDAEMRDRIAEHQARRGPEWRLIEAPRSAPQAIVASASPEHVVLVDCLTLWLTNLMLNEVDLDQEMDALISALVTASGPVVMISNEVGLGLVPEGALGRRFRDAQGRLNQRIAGACETVVFMAAGLPFALKGEAPI